MANITINEISQNYSYNIGTSTFATVALPITSCWGPGFFNLEASGKTLDEMLEETTWQQFPATQNGLETFVSTYRGPAANYRIAKDYSYQMAMTLLTAGYDVLVCRLNPGTQASGAFTIGDNTFNVKAKYPGTFGNSLLATLQKVRRSVLDGSQVVVKDYWNLVTYVVDSAGVRTAVENLVFVFDLDNSTDSILHIAEIDSSFLEFVSYSGISDDSELASVTSVMLSGGTDKAAPAETAAAGLDDAITLAQSRYGAGNGADYLAAYAALKSSVSLDIATAEVCKYREWLYTYACSVYELLEDKLAYNPQRIISPGWDDQNILDINPDAVISRFSELSPIHKCLMNVAFRSRCGAALLDIPKCLPRSAVYNESVKDNEVGYAQMLARHSNTLSVTDTNGSLYASHSALFAPWGQYTYVGTAKQNAAPPSFLNLILHRAMILNQSLQYEWALPTNRKHNVAVGKMDYNVPKKLLDEWQKLEGVGVNIITRVPDLGLTCWGNSTLYEVPPATYQALANLSTRYLVNAVENVAYKCGIAITFQYNNDQAYNAFYAGCTPILDTMKNVGAIDDYYIRMSADIDGLDQVNANSVLGKIYLKVNGVINDITVDLIALPPSASLDDYKA